MIKAAHLYWVLNMLCINTTLFNTKSDPNGYHNYADEYPSRTEVNRPIYWRALEQSPGPPGLTTPRLPQPAPPPRQPGRDGLGTHVTSGRPLRAAVPAMPGAPGLLEPPLARRARNVASWEGSRLRTTSLPAGPPACRPGSLPSPPPRPGRRS